MLLCGVANAARPKVPTPTASQVEKSFKVEGGVMTSVEKPQSELDSLSKLGVTMADSLAKIKGLESAAELTARQIRQLRNDSIDTNGLRHSRFIRDTIPVSRVCAISMVVPGFGQFYNEQYLKIPAVYGLLGASIAGVVVQTNLYSNYKSQYDAMIRRSTDRSPELDRVQTKMIQYNTRRQMFIGMAVASYIYSIGDAALNYKGKTTTIKKATTLSTICPGAGQLYNKSYWKVPIVVGGFASMAYIIDFNNRGYKRFKLAYDIATDGDATTQDEFNGKYPDEFLKNLRNNYRRNRDFSIILTGLFYLLNVVDAHVDSQMKVYNIDDDLSWFDVKPKIENFYSVHTGSVPVMGMSLNFKF